MWWRCSKDHEWPATVSSRAKGAGCPFCIGKQASSEHNLARAFPRIARQWHPTRNRSLQPDHVTPGSSRIVWWKCTKGHAWNVAVSERTGGRGCPYCSGRRPSPTNNLKAAYPKLAREWHPTRNAPLTPDAVTIGSSKKIWWLCKKGHEWPATVGSRTSGRGCMLCSGRRASRERNLTVTSPELVKEWHPTRNGTLSPEQLTPGSHTRIWWLCKKGHEWPAAVHSRSGGTGCPSCHSMTSAPELRVFSEMASVFPDCEHRKRIEGIECDVFIPDHRVAIEYDGVYWHKRKPAKELRKNEAFSKAGILLIRIRQTGLPPVSPEDLFHNPKASLLPVLKSALRMIQKTVGLESVSQRRLARYLKRRAYANDALYLKLQERLPSPLPGTSFADVKPDIAKDWHPTKNGALQPIDFWPYSSRKVWWRCHRGHDWKTTVASRSSGRGCIRCMGRKATAEHNLVIKYPQLAKEWHPTKNGALLPEDVTPGSDRRVWWKCLKGHEWNSPVSERKAMLGCTSCSGRKASKERNFAIAQPEAAREWHLEKNGALLPSDLSEFSDRRVWWQCRSGHEWQTRTASRSQGYGCPYCAGNKVSATNNLEARFPEIARQWHPIKNGPLTAREVTAFSGRRFWWKCSKGHEWASTVANRSSGHGCPHCRRKRH
jgi:hypothetical protein